MIKEILLLKGKSQHRHFHKFEEREFITKHTPQVTLKFKSQYKICFEKKSFLLNTCVKRKITCTKPKERTHYTVGKGNWNILRYFSNTSEGSVMACVCMAASGTESQMFTDDLNAMEMEIARWILWCI